MFSTTLVILLLWLWSILPNLVSLAILLALALFASWVLLGMYSADAEKNRKADPELEKKHKRYWGRMYSYSKAVAAFIVFVFFLPSQDDAKIIAAGYVAVVTVNKVAEEAPSAYNALKAWLADVPADEVTAAIDKVAPKQ